MADRTCSIDGCNRPTKTRGWCGTHYERWRLHGTINDTWTADPTCSIDGCDRPTRARGWCNGHWIRWSRYGDPLAGTPVRADRYKGATCAVDACGRAARSRGWCNAHHYRWLRWGDPLGGKDPLPQVPRAENWVPTYTAAHWRVRNERGPACDHECVDCGEPAAHWSYDNDDPDELIGHSGPTGVLAYSLDIWRYDPRCVSCHRTYDLATGSTHYTERR